MATGWKSLESRIGKGQTALRLLVKKKVIVSGDSGEGQRRVIEKDSIVSGNAWTIVK